MSEQETIVSTSETVLHKPLREIIEYPSGGYAVINLDADRAGLGHRLAELFQVEKLPTGWRRIAPKSRSSDDEEIPFGIPKPGMAVGELDGVSFMLKPKNITYHKDYDPQEEHNGGNSFRQGLISIMREMGLSPDIKRLMASTEMQGFAQKHGFNGIRFIEPIVGIIRKNGRKYLIYEFIDNTQNWCKILLDNEEFKKDVEVETELTKFFAENGIEARETGPMHLLIDSDNVLNLIDVEDFKRKPTSVGQS